MRRYSQTTIWGILRDTQNLKICLGRANLPNKYSQAYFLVKIEWRPRPVGSPFYQKHIQKYTFRPISETPRETPGKCSDGDCSKKLQISQTDAKIPLQARISLLFYQNMVVAAPKKTAAAEGRRPLLGPYLIKK